MIHIKPMEPGPQWADWKKKAKDAAGKIIKDKADKTDKADGQPLTFKEGIWKNFKPFLETIFHEKCAYCEGLYSAGSYMDVEHYRPKAKVTHDNKRHNTVKIPGDGDGKVDHPGYYWLAYDWQNLLLACRKCNAGNGKMNQFPIDGTRASKPEDNLEAEEPLLLNPYTDKNPQDHFTLSKLEGVLKGTTAKGKKTIQITDLNRDELRTARQREWDKRKPGILMKYIMETDSQLVTDDMEYSTFLRLSLAKEVEKKKTGLPDRV